MLDAFISHTSKDVKLAVQIEELLEKEGLKVWLDRSEIRLGTLLRKELQTAIKNSRVLILLWSKAAAKSLWVATEILSAFHLNRFIVPCVFDNTKLPYFLQKTIHLNLQNNNNNWVEELRRAVRNAPKAANEIQVTMSSQSRELSQTITRIQREQAEILTRFDKGDLRGAQEKQRRLDDTLKNAMKLWSLEPDVFNLAGYHYKNAYLLKHWAAYQAGHPPKDRLLERADRYFFKALFINPNDYSALNGLGSVLATEGNLDAAEFFVRRAIALAKKSGFRYIEAEHDLAMILAYKQR
jgi:tetratricopeptide (TPR) repeat protein